MNYVIHPNPSMKIAYQTAAAVCERLKALGGTLLMDIAHAPSFSGIDDIQFLPKEALLENADFVVAIGGDGTILRCAGMILEDAMKRGSEPVRLVGVNTGTLGFLAAFEADELDMLERLQSGQFVTDNRMLLKLTLPGGSVFHAVNDIYASRSEGRIIDFTVFADETVIGTYRADGIILSTPTGSTAYALSAGGPVMEPSLELIEMNLICPHSLFARPMLFSPIRKIRVVCNKGAEHGGLKVHVDGLETAVLHEEQSFTVTVSERKIPFVDCKGSAFYDALNGKLMQPLKNKEAAW